MGEIIFYWAVGMGITTLFVAHLLPDDEFDYFPLLFIIGMVAWPLIILAIVLFEVAKRAFK